MPPASNQDRNRVFSLSPSSTRVYCRPFKRSRAVRIKSNNLELLPDSLRRSIIALKLKQADSKATARQIEQETELDLFEQIRQGVKLKPIGSRRGTGREQDSLDERVSTGEFVSHKNIEDDCDDDGSQVSAVLFRVLRERYLAVQLTDDDDSDLSSIDCGTDPTAGAGNYETNCDSLSHVSRTSQLIEQSFVSISRNGSLNGLLERFAQLDSSHEHLDCKKIELINDLIMRL